MIRRATLVFLAAALALLGLGIALEVVLVPAFTRALASQVDAAALSGLPEQRALELAEQVREYVTGGESALPPVVDGRTGFDEGQVAHLDDVADVITGARIATSLSAFVALVTVILIFRLYGESTVRSGLRAGGYTLLVAVPAAALLGLADFDALFARFHGLFFAAGTWTFPSDTLLIQLFPETFWAVAGATWGAVAMLLGGVFVAVGRRSPDGGGPRRFRRSSQSA